VARIFLIIGQKLVSQYFLFFSLCSKENKWTHVIKWNVQDKNVEKKILKRQKKEKAKYIQNSNNFRKLKEPFTERESERERD
jgi:hypothetical protein